MDKFEDVKNIIRELRECSEINTENELINDLGFDSFCMVMLLVLIEENFEITIAESDMNPFALVTVEDVVRLVEKYTNEDA